jgi:DNA mismatch endonuclease, patch repair protein
MVDVMSVEKRSALMSRIRGTNTKPERLLGSAMHRAGLRYRKHYKQLPGRPDFVFIGEKLAVFVDGDFWHGKEFETVGAKLQPFWNNKIAGNISRDKRNMKELQDLGWRILRFWESDIKKDLEKCVMSVKETLASGKVL